jgi:hypothetical protein
MSNESCLEGWFYKRNGERCGPVSPTQLRELVASGQLRPRQAVWLQGSHSLLFVPAATAAGVGDNGAARLSG